MICDDCCLKKDCQLYGTNDPCYYKQVDSINNNLRNIDIIFNAAKDNDPEFYDELKKICNETIS